MRELRMLVAACCAVLTAAPVGAQVAARARSDTAATYLTAPFAAARSGLAARRGGGSGPLLALQFRHADPAFSERATPPVLELPQESSRWSRAGKGALWGLGVYAVAVGGYLFHEAVACEASCYADGWAPLGIVAWTPVAVGTGAVIGFALPPRR